MNKNNAGHYRSTSERWSKISKSNQARILESVYCGTCSGPVSIILETAKMEQGSLILRGKCKACGHEICRVVEPENK